MCALPGAPTSARCCTARSGWGQALVITMVRGAFLGAWLAAPAAARCGPACSVQRYIGTNSIAGLRGQQAWRAVLGAVLSTAQQLAGRGARVLAAAQQWGPGASSAAEAMPVRQEVTAHAGLLGGLSDNAAAATWSMPPQDLTLTRACHPRVWAYQQPCTATHRHMCACIPPLQHLPATRVWGYHTPYTAALH